MAAAAQRNDGAAAQSELLAFGVLKTEIAFDADRSIVVYRDFG